MTTQAATPTLDPIIAALYARLPADFLPVRTRTPVPAVPLRRVLTCRVPLAAYRLLSEAERPLLEAAGAALTDGLSLSPAAVGWMGSCRPLAVPVDAPTHRAITDLASEQFKGDTRLA